MVRYRGNARNGPRASSPNRDEKDDLTMPNPPHEGYEPINPHKVDGVLPFIFLATNSPAEAYGTLIAAIYKLNFEFIESPCSLDELIINVSDSMRSLREQRA